MNEVRPCWAHRMGKRTNCNGSSASIGLQAAALSGLGLAISKNLVEMMGGHIWVESEPGRGSTFHFHARFGMQAEPMPRRMLRADELKGMRVLVVDDKASAREILSVMVRNDGLEVDVASDGGQALRMIKEAVVTTRSYDLILMDWKMPVMDEIETVGKLLDNVAVKSPAVINKSDDLPLAQLPPLEARFGANYDDAAWSAGALLRLVARQDRVAPNQGNIVGQDIGSTPGFAVLSVNGGWRPRKGALLAAGVDNLFDRSYAEHVSKAGASEAGFQQTTRVNEPGRTAWIKLSLALP